MPTRLNPYLNFDGNARQAIEFYKSVFGGELTMSTFAEGGMPHDPADKDKIMHAQLISPSGYWIMASDTPPGFQVKTGNTMTVSLSGDNDSELRGYWNKLAEGGSVTMPLAKAPWGDSFGMLTDKFGTPWMVNITGAGSA
jgi:PhnB protein